MKSPRHTGLYVCSLIVVLLVSVRSFAQTTPEGIAIDAAKAPELQALHEKNKRDLKTKGHIDNSDHESRFEYVKARIAERKAAANQRGKTATPDEVGFYNATEAAAMIQRLPLRAKKLGSVVASDSERYLITGQSLVKQFYTKTRFGQLLIDEHTIDQMSFDEPNATIAGLPAKIVVSKNKGEKWSTAIYAQSPGRLYVFEIDRRLNDAATKDFVAFVSSAITP